MQVRGNSGSSSMQEGQKLGVGDKVEGGQTMIAKEGNFGVGQAN